MPDHECKHEGDFAVLSRMETTLNNIDKTLRGDNGQGLVTRVTLLEKAYQNIPSLRRIITMATIFGGLAGAVIGLVKWWPA